MKLAPSLLQAISLAMLIPCVASVSEAQAQTVKQTVKAGKDSARVAMPLKKDSIATLKIKTGKLKPIFKKEDYCPPCGRG